MFVSIKLRKAGCAVMILTLIVSALAAVFIPSEATAQEREGIKVPIIMYHSILKNEEMWGDYVLSPIELEKDIVYLKNNGYEAVFVSQLIDYVENGKELPEKPVILSFDDGSYNNLTYVLPLLKKYGFKATFSVVGKYSEVACEDADPSPGYSYLDWKDIKKLMESGYIEIANHSYDMHSLDGRRGSLMNSGESYEDYRQAFYNDAFKTQHLLEDNCGFTPDVYTYPYGLICDASRHLVKSCGFKASLGVEEKMNYICRGDSDCLYEMYRYNRTAFESTEDFMKRLLG
ncbi:polysaccharide deacetylase family protein [Ruminococcus sp. Marseille-P6503]|uniref:polysaccharide deacetylase family protein n=1 Tax=Ruminococcus sp. Marseille-P6503 TaxID=2364796 RepID=UPI000F53C77B|nr:polysaccharide deacetylase family protein [Ruminococcus sp. Marseille-P6503]